MKPHIVNIGDIEDLILAKIQIDKILIETNKIDKKLELNEFLSKYALLNITYFIHSNAIAFNIVNIESENYIFISENKFVDELVKDLESISYDLSKLKSTTSAELIQKYSNIDNARYFVINGLLYVINEEK